MIVEMDKFTKRELELWKNNKRIHVPDGVVANYRNYTDTNYCS